VDIHAVDAVLVDTLYKTNVLARGPLDAHACLERGGAKTLTWGGPRIVPFQFVIIRSSPSAKP
jgi:hypothetical protein